VAGDGEATPGVGKTASTVAWYFGSQSAEQAKQFFGMVHQAFPDLHAEGPVAFVPPQAC
jgi:hypothetical protein